MKITQIKDEEQIWGDFYDFCAKSKPYRNMQVGSRTIQKKFIENIFNHLLNNSDVYLASDSKKICYIFVSEDYNFNRIPFIFGVGRSVNLGSKMAKALHEVINTSDNGKYFKSEIRRSFKVNIYKKWIDKYDKRAIILSDEDQTVLWYNSDKMIGQLKVLSTNKVAQHLLGKTAEYHGFVFKKDTTVTSVLIDKEKYLLDIKDVEFLRDSVVINTLISNDKDFVGRVSLLFKP